MHLVYFLIDIKSNKFDHVLLFTVAYESERDEPRELPPGVVLHGAAKRNSVSYSLPDSTKDPVSEEIRFVFPT